YTVAGQGREALAPAARIRLRQPGHEGDDDGPEEEPATDGRDEPVAVGEDGDGPGREEGGDELLADARDRVERRGRCRSNAQAADGGDLARAQPPSRAEVIPVPYRSRRHVDQLRHGAGDVRPGDRV